MEQFRDLLCFSLVYFPTNVCLIECNTLKHTLSCNMCSVFLCWRNDWVAARLLSWCLSFISELLLKALPKITPRAPSVYFHSAYLSSPLRKKLPEKQTKYCWLKFLWNVFSENTFVFTQVCVCFFFSQYWYQQAFNIH